jgi:hypothetical protein
MVMDWVEGINLARLLWDRGAPGLALSSVLTYLAEAAEALTFLHTHDPPVIHGDVKPANLTAPSSYASASWSGRSRRGERQSYRQPDRDHAATRRSPAGPRALDLPGTGARRPRLAGVIARARREAPALPVSNDAIGVQGFSRWAGRPGRVSARPFATQAPARYVGWWQGSYEVDMGVDQGAVPKLRS